VRGVVTRSLSMPMLLGATKIIFCYIYSNNFKFRGDLTKMINGKVANCLDEVLLLDEDIGGFVGMFLFDSVDDIKDNSDIMKDIFGNVENLEFGDSILMADWNNWNNFGD
jgi:hypothetical protein